MEWHVDDVLYDPPQWEVVFTLENTSDCLTQWQQVVQKNENDSSTVGHMIQQVETRPNSALVIQAGGVKHCVSSLTYGKRVILKMVLVEPGATLVDEALVDQFQSKKHKNKSNKNKSSSKKRRRRRGGGGGGVGKKR